MATLKPLASQGKGNVGVILPDTVSSARYTEFDAPYLTKALQTAGLTSSQFTVQNAQGSDATQLSDAEAAITKGASVLLVDPLDSGVGASIEKYAKSHGVAVINYDRLTLGGSRKYYVSFDNVLVGKLLGTGLASCVTAWKVAKPNVLVMYGAPTDNNATLFAQGYNAVMAPFFSSGKWAKVGTAAGTWDPPTALTEFQGQLTAHKQHQCRADSQRRERGPDHSLSPDPGSQGEDVPGDRAGRDPDRAAEHPHRLPVRNRLQADLPRGAGCSGARDVRPGRRDASCWPGQRQRDRHRVQSQRSVGAFEADMGNAIEYELDSYRRQVRAGIAAVHGGVQGGLHGGRDHGVIMSVRSIAGLRQ